MRLRFLGKESSPANSPTLFATDRNSYVVQGWVVSDPEILATLAIGEDETIVEVPPRLMTYLGNDGLAGELARLDVPIVYVTGKGNYIVRGRKVTDPEALAQMTIPDYETCVEVSKSAMVALLGG